jgi:hypothetical protein
MILPIVIAVTENGQNVPSEPVAPTTGGRNPKFEIRNSKQNQNSNHPNPKPVSVSVLDFDVW